MVIVSLPVSKFGESLSVTVAFVSSRSGVPFSVYVSVVSKAPTIGLRLAGLITAMDALAVVMLSDLAARSVGNTSVPSSSSSAVSQALNTRSVAVPENPAFGWKRTRVSLSAASKSNLPAVSLGTTGRKFTPSSAYCHVPDADAAFRTAIPRDGPSGSVT